MVSRAADLILDHPRATLIAWLAVIVALMPQAALVNGRLTEPSYIVHGTESQRALAIDERTFGPNVELPILVTGPPAAVARTAPRIATALGRLQGINILSPYDSDVTALRPRPGEAMLIAQISTQPSQVLAQAGRVARSTAALVRPPLHASITGEAFIGKSLQDETLAGTHRAEGIAIPVLLIVLLLVFGTPVAAMIPALFGVATVAAGFGVISLLALVMPLEATALSLASMMGLAIGVDYSLLLVARFREELGAATAPEAVRAAARTAVRTAGRTTAFAGATLAIALIVALAVSPGTLILSSIIGVIVVACLSVISAVLVVPAALVLIGPRINRFTIWRRRRGTGARITRGIASLVLRRPAVAAVAIVVPLAVLGAHAFALTPRTPGVDLLPPGDAARVQYAAVSGAMGPGWGATFRVNVSVSRGTLTDARHLGELVDLQHRLTRVPGVAAVIGPAALTSASDAVQGISAQLTSFERSATTTRPQLEHLRHVIATAGSAVTELKGSLTRAANAGGQLAGGAGQARAAAQQLSDGIGQLQGATAQLVSGLDAAASGATQLADGSCSRPAGRPRRP
jgi:RND superfamily putative drug exporter